MVPVDVPYYAALPTPPLKYEQVAIRARKDLESRFVSLKLLPNATGERERELEREEISVQ